jgi:AcrR family transcriptional regulator
VSVPGERRRGRRPLPPEQQRRRLLEAAERSFERNRYEDAGIQSIVREAGMSSRSFYQFFESKEDLVAELIRERAEAFLVEMEEVFREADDLWEAVDQVLRIYLEMLPMVVLDLERLSGPASQRVRRLRSAYREKIGEVLVREIERLVQIGLVAESPDPLSIALILAGIEGISISYHYEGRREELLALHPQLLRALRRFFLEPENPL